MVRRVLPYLYTPVIICKDLGQWYWPSHIGLFYRWVVDSSATDIFCNRKSSTSEKVFKEQFWSLTKGHAVQQISKLDKINGTHMDTRNYIKVKRSKIVFKR
uniref:Uncharacterized protein n=1 Tax=Romanomermis culicivorax TaxID=13658 RepID=A0A915J6R4_ROMCU